jgi:multiple sugar transport system permease protein
VSSAASTREVGSRQRFTWKKARQILGFLYVLPTLVYVSFFFFLPLLLVGWMSLHQCNLLTCTVTNPGPVNIPDNYSSISDNDLFWPAVWFTLEYTILVTVLLVGIGLGLALLVQTGGGWVGALRTSFLIPGALGLATASLLYWGLYSGAIGPLNPLMDGINSLGRQLGMVSQESQVSFLGSPNTALLSTIALIVWKYAGLYMIILLVGLQAIPRDVFEAAAIDGAGRWQTFRSITLPLLRPSLALALILCVTGSLLAFDQFFILTKGGPDNTTVTVVQLIYREAFTRGNLGTAAGISIIVLVVLLVLNTLQFRGLNRSGQER